MLDLFVKVKAADEHLTTEAWKEAQAAWAAPLGVGPARALDDDGVEKGFPIAMIAGIRSESWELCIDLANSIEGVASVLLGPHVSALELLCRAANTNLKVA